MKQKIEMRKEKGKKGKKILSPLRIRRMIFHVLLGMFILFLSINLYSFVKWILFAGLIVGMLLSLLSLRFKLPFIYFMLKMFEKPKYIRKFPGKGTLFFLGGCLLVLKLFPYSIALASIAILTFADPIASISGSLFGKKSHKGFFNKFKKIEGTIFGILAGFIAVGFFVSYPKALIASSVGMVAEALTLQLGGDEVDDNLVVPVAAATALYLVAKFLPLI